MIFSLFFIIFFLVIMVLSLGVTALQFVAFWKVFKKAGKPGWYGIIPFYNMFVLSDIGDTNIIWPIVNVAAPVLSYIISFAFSFGMEMFKINYNVAEPILFLVTLLLSGITIVANFIMMINLAKKFDKDTVFGVGMALIPVVFLTILAFDKSKYNGSSEKNRESKKVLCNNCGELNQRGTNFCTNCGEKL